MNTIIINLFGGPGVGKSVVAAGVFCLLKKQGIVTELVTEFAKDLTWEKRQTALDNQIYILGKQVHKIERLSGQVQVIVLDTSILMSIVYHRLNTPYEHRLKTLEPFVLELFHNMNNVNFLLPRVFEYRQEGRYQNEEQANSTDQDIVNILDEFDISYYDIDVDEVPETTITNIVTGLL
mgnify:CR=1 FL=1